MIGLHRRIDRKLRDAGTMRFARGIGASVLATVIGGALISSATREMPASIVPAPKSSERLASSFVPERGTAPQAMTASAAPPGDAATLPAAMPPVQAAAPVIPVRAPRIVEAATRRRAAVAVVPPARPAERVNLAEAETAVAVREPFQVFGWSVPGSDLLPTGAEAVQTLSELGRQVGRQVASVGGAIGEQVGLR